MKAGDTAYLVESNRFVHEVEILRCNGELYIVCFKDNGVGLYFKAYHLLLTSWKTVKSISQAPEHTDVAGIATVAAVVCAAVCLFLMNFSKSGRTVDESRSWLKRIVVCWAALMTLGAIVTYLEKIIPKSMFTG